MLFNSVDFAVFLPIIFFLYWFVFNHKIKYQNLLIVIASYVFYGWWDWRFLTLIFFSTTIDYIIGQLLSKEQKILKRKILLWTSILVNLGFLGFFKYYNFFLDNFVSAFSIFGTSLNINSISIILPVGISFYTFQTLSYSIDVYRRKLEPTKDFVSFAAFVSFFPQLVAGPIERAIDLLPQFYKQRRFNYNLAINGFQQILWGLFKKIVIADNCAIFVNQIFSNSDNLTGSTLVIGAILFAFQVYGDFSGYSDIAIGTSRFFGFNLTRNFAYPFFSRDIAEFWRRWHISLTTWFKDYLYIPLGGSRGGVKTKMRNTLIIFVVSGFWHGADWTFVVWGALNGLFILPLMITNKNRVNTDIVAEGKIFPSLKEAINMTTTFLLFVFTLTIFRANNLTHAWNYLSIIFSKSIFDTFQFSDFKRVIMTLGLITLFMMIEWIGRSNQYAIENLINTKNKYFAWVLYFFLAFTILLFSGKPQDFFYFQF